MARWSSPCQTSTLRRSGLLLFPTYCRSELQHLVSPQEDRFLVGQRIRQNSRTKKVLYCLLLVCLLCLPDSGKQNGIVPVVGVDGWSRIINENQQFDGMDFEQDNESCTCRIYRKDRNHPICVTEWMDECRREPFKTREGREITGPWQSHPKRMLRHKAMIQCARLAFGFAGIYDKDEAERIVENTAYTAERQPERDITPVNDETMQEINTLLIALDKTWDDDLLPLCSQIFRRDIRASSELTQAEAVKALGFLKQKASEQKVAA